MAGFAADAPLWAAAVVARLRLDLAGQGLVASQAAGRVHLFGARVAAVAVAQPLPGGVARGQLSYNFV